MKIAILGLGTVGSGVKHIVENAKTNYTNDIQISHILIRKGKTKTLPIMCDDIQEIVEDEEVDAVIETMGGIEPAHTYILQALKHKKHVVTANKAVVALYLKEFTKCARKNNVQFRYEASVGGGIPWIEGLSKAMRIDEIHKFYGIFNGTSNFILDHMERYHASFNDILKQAQELGYAEADPSADIDGLDIANKLCISASLAYNMHIPNNFPVFGIRNITKVDIEYFSSLQLHVRLIAKAAGTNAIYACFVEPSLFTKAALESTCQDNFNLITLYGETIGCLAFYGPGAGKLPTANAVVQDLIDIKEQIPGTSLSLTNDKVYDSSLCYCDYILRVHKDAYPYIQHPYETHLYKQQEYLHLHHIPSYEMHKIMQKLLTIDHQAFMVSIHESEATL